MKKILIMVCVFALSLWAVNTFAPIHGEEKIYDSVIRLHVIANSDTNEDQALKLEVRDALLGKIAEIFGGECDRQSAEESLASSIEELRECAESVVRERGYAYTCAVTLTKEAYPKKSYESICFPSGTYTSLQVKIGESEGKNWWCVLYPSICLAPSVNAEQAFTEVGLTPDQYKIITESDSTKYKIRFKLLEVIDNAINH